jgi:SAM-dependent methyltransferase
MIGGIIYMYKLHFGPGTGWVKPSNDWLTVDIDGNRGDIVCDFNQFEGFHLSDESVSCIYGSHVFEHMSIFSAPKVLKECYRMLQNGGYLRIVIPNVRKSMEEYLKGNYDYPLFQRRIEFAKSRFGYEDFSIFEAFKGEFISATGQPDLLGSNALAHQNAWDFEAIVYDLNRAGFKKENVKQKKFRETDCIDFLFEGTYPSEANEEYRSLYVEAQK